MRPAEPYVLSVTILASVLYTDASSISAIIPSLACQPLNQDSFTESAAALLFHGPLFSTRVGEGQAATISSSPVRKYNFFHVFSNLTLAVVAVKKMPGPS